MADGRPLIAKIQVEHSGGSGAMAGGNRNVASSGASGGSIREKQVARDNKTQTETLKDIAKTSKFSLLRTLGISATAASILKQSQIWTGTLGAFFQIFGALIDLLLAPLIPVLIPFLQKFAKAVPKIAERIGIITTSIVNAAKWIKLQYDRWTPEWLKNLLNSMIWGPLKLMLGTYVVARLLVGQALTHGLIKTALGTVGIGAGAGIAGTAATAATTAAGTTLATQAARGGWMSRMGSRLAGLGRNIMRGGIYALLGIPLMQSIMEDGFGTKYTFGIGDDPHRFQFGNRPHTGIFSGLNEGRSFGLANEGITINIIDRNGNINSSHNTPREERGFFGNALDFFLSTGE